MPMTAAEERNAVLARWLSTSGKLPTSRRDVSQSLPYGEKVPLAFHDYLDERKSDSGAPMTS